VSVTGSAAISKFNEVILRNSLAYNWISVNSSKSVSYAGYMSIKAPSAIDSNFISRIRSVPYFILGDKEY